MNKLTICEKGRLYIKKIIPIVIIVSRQYVLGNPSCLIGKMLNYNRGWYGESLSHKGSWLG